MNQGSNIDKKNKIKDQDFKTGCALLLIAILGYYYSVEYIYSIGTVGVAPDFYPKLLFIILGICGLGLMFQGYKREDKKPMPVFKWKMLLPTIVLLILYAILLEYTGFIISSVVFMVLFMLLLGERKPVTIISVPVITTLIIYFLFTKAFMIVLP